MSTIDIERLLTEIDPEAPSGEKNLVDTGDPAWVALDIKMKGTPEQFDGTKIVQEAKDPNWAEVRDDAFKLLTRTHDLRVAVSFTRALIHCQGVQGLSDGLTLLHGLIARYWDTLYPPLDPDDNDPTIRNTALEALSFGDDILGPLKKADLCASRALGRYSYRDILIASGKLKLPAKESANVPGMTDIEAAFKDTDVADLSATKTFIDASLEHLDAMTAELSQKIGDTGSDPDLNALRTTLQEMKKIMDTQLADRQGEGETQAQNSTGAVEEPSATTIVPATTRMNAVNSRQDVIRLIDLICNYYDRSEPGSPVPLILKRARQLVDKNFIEILQDLAPDTAGKMKTLISGAEK